MRGGIQCSRLCLGEPTSFLLMGEDPLLSLSFPVVIMALAPYIVVWCVN